MWDTIDIVLWFNIRQAAAAGIKFYVSQKRVILTEGADRILPMQYLKSGRPASSWGLYGRSYPLLG